MSLRTRLTAYGIALVMSLSWLWFKLHRHDNHVDQAIASTVLPASDSEKLIVDPRHHTIEVVTRNEKGQTVVSKQYLNPRGVSSIEEKKDGTLKVNQRTWGTETSPFAGVAIGSDVHLRGAFGLNLLYVHSFDFGVGLLASSAIKDTRGMVDVTYNFFGNLSAGVYVDHKKDAGILCSLRF